MPKPSKIEIICHSTSHILAAVIQQLFSGAKFGIGPVIKNGFYYDFDLPRSLTPQDLPKIEKKMKEMIKKNLKFTKEELTINKAIDLFKKLKQPYKVELIKDLQKEEKAKKVTIYKTGDFTDLCRGPHIQSTKEIKFNAFKLTKIAGAYWKGDEKNKMFQRIYGVAFNNKKELDEYLVRQTEAEKRDHRKLGKELDLFLFHESAPGSPYWLEKGLIIMNQLLEFWRTEHRKRGYQEIASPLINKKELWEKSGHWEHFKKDMFIADMGENEIYGVKPMNCPNAMIVYKSKKRSYRELPIRLSDVDILHRYEKSGTLNGLLRVRSFRQDDSHNFITEDQIKEEYSAILEIVKLFYDVFEMKYSLRLGTRPKKFLGDIKSWNKAEKNLKDILDDNVGKNNYQILKGDGAFYGPKIDILMKDSLDREWQMGTIQLDSQIPRKFNLKYTNKNGQEKIPVVIHRVIYGSLERFIGILLEHYAGALPVWLSPTQVQIIPVGQKFNKYGEKIKEELLKENIRIELNNDNETLGKKIREGELQKIPYLLIVGDKEIKSDSVAVRDRKKGDLGIMKTKKFIAQIKEEIEKRK